MAFGFELDEQWTEVLPGVRQRPIIQAHGTILILHHIDAGRRFPSHRHPQAQFGLILEGRGRQRVGGAVRRLDAGDSYYIPPNVPHEVRVDPGGPMVVLDVAVAATPRSRARPPAPVQDASDPLRGPAARKSRAARPAGRPRPRPPPARMPRER